MSSQKKTVGTGYDDIGWSESTAPRVLTWCVWTLWLVSIAAMAVYVHPDLNLEVGLDGVVAIDGLTVVMWSVVTFISGTVHSYSRRYMAGSRRISGFFVRVFGFTVFVMVLVAADSLVLFAVAWLSMGLVMADLIGYSRGWKQAREAARKARIYFVGGTAFLSVGVAVLWFGTGSTTVSGAMEGIGGVTDPVYLAVVGVLLVAVAVQSALVPFHGWLLSSMTAPTPASALMHAGFVNAGGILLVRFSPVFSESLSVMTAIVVVGAFGAIFGKLMKSVRPDIKSTLGCSTAGQMGFMVMQAGLGFFSAAVAHLILHGFYKAYLFMSSSGRVEDTSPEDEEQSSLGVVGALVTLAVALAGGLLFVFLTGKGASLDSGLLLTLLVVLTAAHATRDIVRKPLPSVIRYVAVPVVFLTAVTVYAVVFEAVTAVMEAAPVPSVIAAEPTELTVVHVVVGVAFVAAYVAIEFGYVRRSNRLYVALLNFSQPSSETVLTKKEEYNEY